MCHCDCRVTTVHGKIKDFALTLPCDRLVTHQVGGERVGRIFSCSSRVGGCLASNANRRAVLGELQAGHFIGISAKHLLFVIIRDVLRSKSCFFTVACSEGSIALNMIDLFVQIGAIVPVVGVSFAVSVFVLIVGFKLANVPNVGACVD